jgi:hypothetical protein
VAVFKTQDANIENRRGANLISVRWAAPGPGRAGTILVTLVTVCMCVTYKDTNCNVVASVVAVVVVIVVVVVAVLVVGQSATNALATTAFQAVRPKSCFHCCLVVSIINIVGTSTKTAATQQQRKQEQQQQQEQQTVCAQAAPDKFSPHAYLDLFLGFAYGVLVVVVVIVVIVVVCCCYCWVCSD